VDDGGLGNGRRAIRSHDVDRTAAAMLRKCQVKRKMKGKFEDEGVFSVLLS